MTPTRVDGHKLLNFASQVEYNTLDQAKETASMSFVHPHVALMPDAHSGKGSAVGTVIPTLDAVIPAAVGVDIGCGMIAVKTRFLWSEVEERWNSDPWSLPGLPSLRQAIEAAIPLSPGNYNADTTRFPFTKHRVNKLYDLAQESKIDLSHSPKWPEQLGSLGGGNHFIELCVDNEGTVWLFLHSGSRGVGNKIAQKHIRIAQRLMKQWYISLPNPDLAYLPQGTPEFTAYIKELSWAQKFAFENRAEMMDRFVDVFADWYGVQAQRVEVDRINCHHNYTRKEHHGGRDVWLTRKGAVDAHEGVRAIIPGSMGTHSYVVRGKGNAAALCSAPHGAGRRFSRTEARKRFTEDDLATAMAGIEYRHGAEWIDEIPGAYKDIDVVMKDAEDLVEIEYELRQVLNVKGT